jgi:hypothetical protein
VSPWGLHQFRATNMSFGNLLSLAYGIDPRYIKGVPAHLLHAAHKDPFRTVLCWAPHELRAKQVPVAILPGLPQ